MVTAWFPCDHQFPVASAEEGSVPYAHCNSSDPVLAVVRALYLCLGNASNLLLQPARHVPPPLVWVLLQALLSHL